MRGNRAAAGPLCLPSRHRSEPLPMVRTSEPEGKKRSDISTSITASMSPIKKEAFGYEQARHLLWRAGFGGTPAQIQTLVNWGPERSVEHLLEPQKDEAGKSAYEPVKPDQFSKDIMGPPSAEEQRLAAQARRNQDEKGVAQLRLKRQER